MKKEIVKRKTYSQILTDSKSGTQFQLDTFQIIITAINSSNDTLWKTYPWKDSNLGEYRVKRQIINYFMFVRDDVTGKIEIAADYNNSQFGKVDLKTGSFRFLGQD